MCVLDQTAHSQLANAVLFTGAYQGSGELGRGTSGDQCSTITKEALWGKGPPHVTECNQSVLGFYFRVDVGASHTCTVTSKSQVTMVRIVQNSIDLPQFPYLSSIAAFGVLFLVHNLDIFDHL